jgi:hypothetical protein
MSALATTTDFDGIEGEVSGFKVLIAVRNGIAEAVEVESIREGLGVSRDDPIWPYLQHSQIVGRVLVGGMLRTTYLVSLEAFFKFCMLNPSPKLDSFRDGLARIARSIQDRGSYIDPQAGAKAFIPPGLEDNKTAQMLAALMQQEVQMQRLGQEVAGIKSEIADVRQQIGRGPLGWTIAGWFSQHNHKATEDVIRCEGMRAREICIALGTAVPPDNERVCNGGKFPARVWPLEVIRVWWRDYCRRNDMEVYWRI